MSPDTPAFRLGQGWFRTAFSALVLISLSLSGLAGPVPARAALASQQQGLCSLLPAGSYVEDDTATHCIIQYQESDGSYYAIELSLFSSPDLAYNFLNPNPFDCAVGTSSYLNCLPLDIGDEAPPGFGNSYKGVTYSLLSSNDTAAAWRRGCYLLKGTTWYLALKDKMMQTLQKLDGQLTTSACPGCADPTQCQATGSGSGSGTGSGSGGSGSGGSSSSVCGAGVPAPAGPFAVSGYGCQYEETSDGVTCQAAVVNACPDADLWYTWSLDGTEQLGFVGDLFNPTDLGLCAGDHTVSVYAEDLENNLTATGISWTFTTTKGQPCPGGTGGALNVAAPSCNYFSDEDRILCTAQVIDPPPGADIEYEWKWNGAVQAETGGMLDILVKADFRIHTFEVIAKDRASGKVSSPASASVQVGQPPLVTRPEYIQVETPGGLFEIPGLNGEKSTIVEWLAGADAARLYAVCPELYKVELMRLVYSEEMRSLAHWDVPISKAQAVVTSVLLKCAGLADAGKPLLVAAVGDAAALASRGAPEDLPVQLRIEMLGGPLRLTAVSDQVLVDVQTSEASVRSAGKNDFGVAFDAQTGDTTVAVYGGYVEVYSMGSALQLAALREGQQVTVSGGQVSEVTRTTGAGGARSLLIGLACLAGLAVLAALIVFAVVRSRRNKHASAPVTRTQAPPHATPPHATGPRLVVTAGKASAAAADLSRGPATIGRHPSNSLVLYDPLVSEQHAQVSYQNGFWVLMDLGSRNGTFLNGVRIQRQALRSGDRIQVGQTLIVFQSGT